MEIWSSSGGSINLGAETATAGRCPVYSASVASVLWHVDRCGRGFEKLRCRSRLRPGSGTQDKRISTPTRQSTPLHRPIHNFA